MIELLQKRNWNVVFNKVISGTTAELFISSPYITDDGSKFISTNLSDVFRRNGKMTVLTNLSPINMAQGVTDPEAINIIAKSCHNFDLWHLPSLHAKIYISDKRIAIITSANLTKGGLVGNYEYGASLSDPKNVEDILDDAIEYCRLGSQISMSQLQSLSLDAQELKEISRKRKAGIQEERKFSEISERIQVELVKYRLNVGSINNVFSNTILYLLRSFVGMTTKQIEEKIKEIHPDLCDDSVDRVCNNIHYGKKWKHFVRNAQKSLKKDKKIDNPNGRGGIWILLQPNIYNPSMTNT
jgi:HKD family nuclease